MRTILFFSLSALLVFSCKEDDPVTEPPSSEVTDLEIVTGVDLSDENGQELGFVGNPNRYGGLMLFPNPPSDIQAAMLQSGEGISALQILPAVKSTEFTETEVTEAFTSFAGYPASEVQSRSAKTINVSSANQQIQYRLTGLAPGYYRVIATDANGLQHGSTIFVDSTLSYPNGLRDSLFADWP